MAPLDFEMELPPSSSRGTVSSIRAGLPNLAEHLAMRAILVAPLVLVSLVHSGTGSAAECPPDALGVTRTIVVDPREHTRIGALQYKETLPLNDKEVVLTFDDGPVPRHTGSVLETLAAECTKATFFMVGQMANSYPAMVRRVYDEGHTIANHSQTHPFTFNRMSLPQAAAQIEGAFASLRAALGEGKAVAPFFRIPGLLRQDSVEHYLAAHGVMTWSLDVVADDWTHIGADEIARRAISRLEARGKGVLLLHDIHEKTALALPVILKELKARGFKIVHVVPATPDRPKTMTQPEQWAAHTSSDHQLWPRVSGLDFGSTAISLAAPHLRNLGVVDPSGKTLEVSLARRFARGSLQRGGVPLPPIPPWPRQVYFAPTQVSSLPAPAEENFRYSRVFEIPPPDRTAAVAQKRTASTASQASKPRVLNRPAAPFTSQSGVHTGVRAASPPRLFGHQL
jgi:peptidoglycan/xylan/chitin deacetylase (PgdA/CDA1 family)